jgi:hypothetical protein
MDGKPFSELPMLARIGVVLALIFYAIMNGGYIALTAGWLG